MARESRSSLSTGLQGSSGESFDRLAEDLSGRLDAAGDPAVAAKACDDLFAVSQLLRSEPGLRRVASDASIDAEAKQGLIGSVLSGKVDQLTLDLLRAAVERRWTRGSDLPASLDLLSEIAAVKSAGTEQDRLADELFSFRQIVTGIPELRDALSNPGRSVDDKVALVGTLLTGSALDATVTLAKQALAGNHGTLLSALDHYQDVAAAVRSQSVAEVRVARPLSADDERRLAQTLSRQYGRDVHLNVVVDPSVLGGIRVEIGDQIIDGTIASRLDDARRRLAG